MYDGVYRWGRKKEAALHGRLLRVFTLISKKISIKIDRNKIDNKVEDVVDF